MTRFVYMADTHFGANPMGYQMQPGYPERLPELLRLLDAWIAEHGPVDFILHGGDMLDGMTPANLTGAREAFRLPVPVHLCLGNHDLTTLDALDAWLAGASEFFPGGRSDYSVYSGECGVHVVTSHWQERPYHWVNALHPHFLPGQLDRVEHEVAAHPELVHILLTHNPVLDVPGEQRGETTPFHLPPPAFTETIQGMVQRHPEIRFVLGAHNHANMHVVAGGVHYVTATSFSETPFEFKVIEVTPESIRMSTVALLPGTSFAARYDFDRTWVQGRLKDRAFVEERRPPEGGTANRGGAGL